MYFKPRLIPAAVTSVLLAACGGGGDGSNSVASNPSRGRAIDGYLSLSKVVCDTNENGVADAGETVTYTDIKGNFVFAQACKHTVLASGGTNADTGLPFVGQLRAPAGATVVTPLTTLMAAGVSQELILAALSLPPGTNLLTKDPAATTADGALVDADLLKKTLAVQQMVQKTSEMFTGMGAVSGSVASEAVYTQVSAAFAEKMKTGSKLIGADAKVDSAVLNDMVGAAVTRTSNASSVPAEIKTAITSAGGAATLPTVIQTALADQAQSILNADSTKPAEITAVTKDRQSNTSIADGVKTAVDSGALSDKTKPDDLKNVATSVAEEAKKPTPPPPDPQHVPVPASGSTTLLTFDESPVAFSGMGAYGGALPSVEAPAIGDGGNALKIVKPIINDKGEPNPPWGGIYFDVAKVPFTSDRKKITAAVYSTRANAVVKLKVETNDKKSFVEVAGTAVGAANTWTTVTWDFSAVSTDKIYTTMAITPDAEVATSGQGYYLDNIALAPASGVPPVPPAPTNYLYLPDNAIGYSADGSNGGAVTYSMATFQSTGINVKWPMSDKAAIKLKLAQNGTFSFAAGQTLSAAVQIEDTASQGQIRAYTDKVVVSKSGTDITLSVPDLPQALIYGVSGDGKTKAVINFASKVKGITNTLSMVQDAISTVMFGEVVNFGITGLSNDFNNMGALRGKYKVTIVVNELPLKKADGTPFDSKSISVPTSVAGGVDGGIIPVNGYGLVGYINLTTD